MTAPLKRRWISLLFAASAVLWAGQFLFHELVSEPWPSVTFPRFGQVGGSYDPEPQHRSLREVVVYDAGGQAHQTTPEGLFGHLSYNLGTVFSTQYSPASASDRDEPESLLKRIHAWPSQRLEAVLGDVPPFSTYYQGQDGAPRGNSDSSRVWLQDLLAEWMPGHTFERVEFVWHSYRGHTLGVEVDEQRVTRETYVVELR